MKKIVLNTFFLFVAHMVLMAQTSNKNASLPVTPRTIGNGSTNGQQKFITPVILNTNFRKDTFSIVKYGAIPDGVNLNTKAINAAIDACHKKGGGIVLVPKGIWITGPLVLKSNVNLHLAKSAMLKFTGDFNEYPLVEGNWEGVPQMRNQSPISATDQKNVGITGSGIIDGDGDAWRMVKKDKMTDAQWKTLLARGGALSNDKKIWYPSEKSLKGASMDNPGVIHASKTAADYEAVKDFLRPNMIVFTRCNQVLLEGVTFQNSSAWNIHPLMTNNLTVRNVYVKNPWYAQNGDGIDVESCSNVLIENSTFDVGDDAICIKSGKDSAGRKRGLPTKDVIVRNCTVYHAHGGFVIGSEMSGGANNISVTDCTFIGTDIGLRFKTTRGRGGIVENIFISGISMEGVVGEAILFDMYYAAKDPVPLPGEKVEPVKVETLPVTEATPRFRNFYISNVVCAGAGKGIFVRGIPEMNVEGISMENMTLSSRKGIEINEGSFLKFKNIRVITNDTDPVVSIHNSGNITFDGVRYPENSKLLFNITGDKSKAISVSKADIISNVTKVKYSYGADSSTLTEH